MDCSLSQLNSKLHSRVGYFDKSDSLHLIYITKSDTHPINLATHIIHHYLHTEFNFEMVHAFLLQ